MIRQKLYIDRYDWLVYCFFLSTADDAAEILRLIDTIGIDEKQYERARVHLRSRVQNNGMTYSNTDSHISVMVIGDTTSPAETMNTFSHELRHLTDAVSSASGIDSEGEKAAYLTGDIALALASILLSIVCDCPVCKNVSNYRKSVKIPSF